MVNIDLKSSGIERSAYETKTDFSLWFLFLLVVVVLGAWGGIYFWKDSLIKQNKAIEDEITLETNKLNGPNAKSIMDVQERAQTASGLVDKENLLNMSLAEIEKNIVPGAYIKSINYTKEEVVISLVAKDFTTLAKQLSSFKQKAGKLKEASAGPAKVNAEGKVEAVITFKSN